MFPPGVEAQVNGQEVSSLDIRLTEFTVGALGEAAVPGELPPNS